jgi:hypothetical protein
MLTGRALLHATAATGAATLVGVGDLPAAKYDLPAGKLVRRAA